MYSQTSSSVQFDMANTRIVSPFRIQVLKRFHSSGLCCAGPRHVRANGRRRCAPWPPALFLIRPSAPERRIKAVAVEGLLERIGLHHLRVQRRSGIDRVNAALDPILIYMHDQVDAEPLGRLVAEADHLAKLPGGIDMQQWERDLCRIEGLQRKVQHDARILADRIEHYWLAKFGNDVAHDLDGLSLQPP